MTKKMRDALMNAIREAEYTEDECDENLFIIAADNEFCFNGTASELSIILAMAIISLADTTHIPRNVMLKIVEKRTKQLMN